MKQRITASIVALSLAACSAQPQKITPQHNPVFDRINESAGHISESLNRISRMVYAESPVKATPQSRKWRGELAKPITMYWPGELVAGLKAIAHEIGYTGIAIEGRAPATPITVIVDAKNMPAGEVIEDIGWQAGREVGVVIDESSRQIKVIYKKG